MTSILRYVVSENVPGKRGDKDAPGRRKATVTPFGDRLRRVRSAYLDAVHLEAHLLDFLGREELDFGRSVVEGFPERLVVDLGVVDRVEFATALNDLLRCETAEIGRAHV